MRKRGKWFYEDGDGKENGQDPDEMCTGSGGGRAGRHADPVLYGKADESRGGRAGGHTGV